MEEYRAIAKRILVPSFFSLLTACSAIFLAYSFLFDSKLKTAIGLFFFVLSFLALFFYMRYSSFKLPRDENKSEINAGSVAENRPDKTATRPVLFYHTIITLLIAGIIVFRILTPSRYVPVAVKADKFIGITESVKALRYSNEVVISFIDADRANKISVPSLNKAVSYTDKEIKINPGDELIILTKPVEIRADKKNISSFELDLLRKGFHYIFYLNNKNVKIRKTAQVTFKNRIRNAIENNLRKLFDEKTIPVLKGLYFANGSYIDKTTKTDFKRAGVLHILAASGEHIGIIIAVLLILFNPLLISRKIVRVIILVFLFFYLYITDMPVSLLRAFVMYYVYSIQYFFDFDKNILNTLFISAIVILIIYPYELYSLGFQLSFGATFGIIVFYNFYKDVLSFLPAKISQIMSVTFSAQAVIFPIVFIQLKEINLTGLLSNVVLVFTMSVTLITSLIANLFSIATMHLAKYIAMITDISYSISLKIIQHLSGIGGHFLVSNEGYLLLIPYFLFLLPVIPAVKNKKFILISLVLSVFLSWSILSGGYSASGKNRILIYNNDNNSIMLLKNNNVNVMYGSLTDTAGAELIAKYCGRNNVRNIILCIFFPDFKNLKSFSYLIKKTIVSECIISPDFMFSGHFRKFCKTLDTDGIKLKILKYKNYNESTLNKDYDSGFIKKILESPLENIDRIYFLLAKNYEQKNSVIKNITDNGFEIEYLK